MPLPWSVTILVVVNLLLILVFAVALTVDYLPTAFHLANTALGRCRQWREGTRPGRRRVRLVHGWLAAAGRSVVRTRWSRDRVLV